MGNGSAILVGHEVVPVDMPEWAEWMEGSSGRDNRTVALTELPDGKRVSTVFLGLDHSLWGDGPPLWFETMVFPPDSWSDLDMARYSTWDEAFTGHEQMVEKWRAHEEETEDATLQGH